MAELQELTENENSLLEHLQTLPQIKRLSDDRNDLGNKNEKLARKFTFKLFVVCVIESNLIRFIQGSICEEFFFS